MGSEAENIFNSFMFAEEGHQDDFNIVTGKFDEYFFLRRNIIHERACFHQSQQQPGEKAECFIRALYKLSELTDFGITRNENIRDHIGVGIMDKDLSRRLQLMADLTLAQTIQTVRQSEDIATQVSMQGETVGTVQEVAFKHNINWNTEHKKKCPAAKAVCNICHTKGY